MISNERVSEVVEWLIGAAEDASPYEHRMLMDAAIALGERNPVQQNSALAARAREILAGIDSTEVDASDGWWETSSGAEFGAKKLAEILELLK